MTLTDRKRRAFPLLPSACLIFASCGWKPATYGSFVTLFISLSCRIIVTVTPHYAQSGQHPPLRQTNRSVFHANKFSPVVQSYFTAKPVISFNRLFTLADYPPGSRMWTAFKHGNNGGTVWHVSRTLLPSRFMCGKRRKLSCRLSGLHYRNVNRGTTVTLGSWLRT